MVEGARLESDCEIAQSVTKPHNSCVRTHYLSHIPSNKVTLCHTESTQQSTQLKSVVRRVYIREREVRVPLFESVVAARTSSD